VAPGVGRNKTGGVPIRVYFNFDLFILNVLHLIHFFICQDSRSSGRDTGLQDNREQRIMGSSKGEIIEDMEKQAMAQRIKEMERFESSGCGKSLDFR